MCKKKYLIKGMKDGIETGKMKRNAYLKLVVTDATGSHYYVKSKKKIYEYLEGVTDDV